MFMILHVFGLIFETCKDDLAKSYLINEIHNCFL